MAGLRDKWMKMWNPPEDEYEYEEYPEEAQASEEAQPEAEEPRRSGGGTYSFSSFVPRDRDFSSSAGAGGASTGGRVVNINAKTQLLWCVSPPPMATRYALLPTSFYAAIRWC